MKKLKDTQRIYKMNALERIVRKVRWTQINRFMYESGKRKPQQKVVILEMYLLIKKIEDIII